MKDKCIVCQKKTLYDKEDHIDFRIGYIEGAGQLCLDCYDNVVILGWDKVPSKENAKGVNNENNEILFGDLVWALQSF